MMNRIHREIETPFKYGIVLRGEDGERVDGPKVFRHGDRWFMFYTTHKESIGYETCLAQSPDLLHWEKLGRILPFRRDGWDAWQAHGAPALIDHAWDGAHAFRPFDGKYWMTYVGGALQGYETDPLSIGLAWADSPVQATEWTRLPEPILTSAQSDARPFEQTTLYTSTIIQIDPALLGFPFIMFYNAKTPPDGHEAIGMAVSHDLRNWRRFGREPVIENVGDSRWALSGNPQIVKIGEAWVMFYFGAFWKPNAFDTFAVSYDLVHWTKWNGPHLVEPSEPYDKQFAHKPWALKHDGIVYHFYCAVGDQGRVIALATSRDLRPPD
jgi:beta-xylosidase